MKKMLDSIGYVNWLFSIYSVIFTWQGITQILTFFNHVGDLEITIFAGVIGFGLGTITSLTILSIGCIFYPGLLSLLAMWFWSGSYIAIIAGGSTGGLTGVICGIFMRISIAKYYL